MSRVGIEITCSRRNGLPASPDDGSRLIAICRATRIARNRSDASDGVSSFGIVVRPRSTMAPSSS